ncbi:MAG: alpha/beta hydrolase [Cyanobacteria bacterium J06592_8]
MINQFEFNLLRLAFLSLTTSYHLGKTWLENQNSPPGQFVDVGGYKLHFRTQGSGTPTVILDHSLGGIEGYFLIDKIAEITRVCIYDRPGYGWSEASPKPRCSEVIVRELNELLETAEIEPPYILVGDSFGSYTVRLYAHYYPEKVRGIILTDGLSEISMLKLPLILKAVKLLFVSGFLISILGSILGFVRLLGDLGVFELIKPELRKFSPDIVRPVKRSFYRSQHWRTMFRELWNLEKSASQLQVANSCGDIPLITIKSQTFFKRSLWTFYLPLKKINQLREQMHANLLTLSTTTRQLSASKSSHFVWVDEPEIILAAIEQLIGDESLENSPKG